MRLGRTFVATTVVLAAALSLPTVADARGGAGGWHGGAGGWQGGAGHAFHGGPGHYDHGRYWGHRGYWPGAFWGGVGLGLGIGAIGYWGAYDPVWIDPGWAPVVVDAPPVTLAPAYGGDPTRTGQPVPQAPRAPDPIFYPKNGQSAQTTEQDRRECNRWATAQPGAMADASIFQRATFACMEGRGYSVR